MPKTYPSCLLPGQNYRYRLPMRKLVEDYPDLAVVRRCKHPQPFVYSASGQHEQLRSDVFGDEDLRELSCNLLGGLFKMKHLPVIVFHSPAHRLCRNSSSIPGSPAPPGFPVPQPACTA